MAKRSTTPVASKPMTKNEIFKEIAATTGISRKDVSKVFEELGYVVERHIKKKAIGSFTLPGLLKIKAVLKPARKAQKAVPNPFKPGELMDVPARPAMMKVKVLPLKKLKQMVA